MLRMFSIVTLGMMAVCAPARAEIISFDYAIDFAANPVGSGTGAMGTGTFAPLDFSFSYAAGVLDLGISGLASGIPSGGATTWTFTNATFLPLTDSILGVTQTTSPAATSVGFTADSITIVTADDTPTGTSLDYSFNVALSSTAGAAVPEPSSLAGLALIGLGGLWVRRRRQAV